MRYASSVEMPNQSQAKGPAFDHTFQPVALSISAAEDSGRFGLRPAQLDSMFTDLSRCLLSSGIRLAYGGHWQAGGYSARLAELAQGSPERSSPSVALYLAWPISQQTAPSLHEGARTRVEVHPCVRPSDLDDPTFGEAARGDGPVDSPERRFAWARGLSSMRERQTAEVAARIVIGGKIGTAGGYLGRMPGVLEEALLGIRAGRPVYLVGAFGGSARVVLDALEGTARRELTWQFHRVVPYSSALKELYAARGMTWDEYETIADELTAHGMSGLRNGLSLDENRELARSRSFERIAELVLTGLTRCHSA